MHFKSELIIGRSKIFQNDSIWTSITIFYSHLISLSNKRRKAKKRETITTRMITEGRKRKRRKKPEKLIHHLASEIATFRASLASVFGQIIVFAAFMDHFCSVPETKLKKRGEITESRWSCEYTILQCNYTTNIHIRTHVHTQTSSPLSCTTRARAYTYTHHPQQPVECHRATNIRRQDHFALLCT